MKNDIAAVVVTYNRKELLQENLQALLGQTCHSFDILVVDNHSTDGTYEDICPLLTDGRLYYHDTGENLGGAGGFQYGIKKAVEAGYRYVWLMDDDCIPKADALEALVHAYSRAKKQLGFLSSKVLWKDGSLCRMNVQRRTMAREITDFSQAHIPTVMASFVSLFLPVDVIRNVGLPIKEFFIWSDDWEYTRRISKKYSCYTIPTSIVIHKTKENSGANIVTDTRERLERYRYIYRNDVFLFRREGISGYAYMLIRAMAHVIRILLFAKSKKWLRIRIIAESTAEGFRFHPPVEYV